MIFVFIRYERYFFNIDCVFSCIFLGLCDFIWKVFKGIWNNGV